MILDPFVLLTPLSCWIVRTDPGFLPWQAIGAATQD